MKNEVFEELLSQLKIEKEKIILLKDVDAIILNNGVGIYPNISHLRFLITPKNDILIQHGTSKPYGGKLSSNYQVKIGYQDILFNSPKPVLYDGYSTEYFRNPMAGDILCIFEGNEMIQQTLIDDISQDIRGFYIHTVSPLKLTKNSLLSFYDPKEFHNDSCIHTSDAIYLKYTINPGKNIKKYGIFHETIHLKDIKEIRLSLKSKNTYTIS